MEHKGYENVDSKLCSYPMYSVDIWDRSLTFLVIFFPRALISFFDNFVIKIFPFYEENNFDAISVIVFVCDILIYLICIVWRHVCDCFSMLTSQIWNIMHYYSRNLPPAARLQYSGVCSHQKSHQEKWSQQTENLSFLLVKNWI